MVVGVTPTRRNLFYLGGVGGWSFFARGPSYLGPVRVTLRFSYRVGFTRFVSGGGTGGGVLAFGDHGIF